MASLSVRVLAGSVFDQPPGDDTVRGVRWYQGMRGIAVTGEVDNVTWRNMRIEPTF